MNKTDEQELRRLLSKVGEKELKNIIDSVNDNKNYAVENNQNDYILDEETMITGKPIQDYHTNQILERFSNRKNKTIRDVETYRQLNYIHNYGVKRLWEDIRIIVESKKEIDMNDLDGILTDKDLY